MSVKNYVNNSNSIQYITLHKPHFNLNIDEPLLNIDRWRSTPNQKIYFKIMNDVITFDSLVQRSKQFTKDVNVDVSIIF
jgi:hypothetical protein